MATLSENVPTIYGDEQNVPYGRNGGTQNPGQLIPVLPTSVEEYGGSELTLVVANVIQGAPLYPMQLFDGRHLFMHAS